MKRGHIVGNHGMEHLNGLKVSTPKYHKDVMEASGTIRSKLFRPAYGKLKPSQYKMLKDEDFEVIFWSVMAYDFDETLASSERIKKMKALTENGAIFVFHDNQKSIKTLKNDLPQLMEWWRCNEYTFKSVSVG